MSDNPYEKILEENESQFSSGNEYDDFLEKQKQQSLGISSDVASDKNPDQHAKVVSLASQLGAQSRFVEENYEIIQKQRENFQLKKTLSESSVDKPKTTDFMADPDNLALAKDDLDQLIKLENATVERGAWSQIGNQMKAASIGAVSGLAKLPAYLASAAVESERQRQMFELGLSEDEIVLPSAELVKKQTEGLRKNIVTEYLDKKSMEYSELAPLAKKEFLKTLNEEGPAAAGKVIAVKWLGNSPTTLGILAAAATGYGGVALTTVGASTIGSEYAEAIEKPGVTTEQALTSSTLKGAAEVLTESLGTLGFLKGWGTAVTTQFGKQTAREVFLNTGKLIGYNALGEGAEEGVNAFAADFADYATGINPLAFEGAGNRYLEASLIGGLSGAGMTAPTGISLNIAKAQQIQQTKNDQNLYKAIGEVSENSKLKQRLPEKYKEYVETVTKDGPVENIYINQDGFKSYAQSINKTPEQLALEMGINQEFSKAAESESDVIEVKTAVMADKVAGTEYYQGIKNDVKFKVDGLTPNEMKEQIEQDKASVEEEYKAAKEGKSEEDIKTVEDSAKEVQKIVYDRLRSGGYGAKEAKSNSEVFSKKLEMLGLKSGQMPKDIFDKYGVNINFADSKAELPIIDTATIYNQATNEILTSEVQADESVTFKSIDGKSSMNMRLSRGTDGTAVVDVNQFNYDPELTSNTAALLETAEKMAVDNGSPLVVFNPNSFGANKAQAVKMLEFHGYRAVKRLGKLYMQKAVGGAKELYQKKPQVSDLGFYSKLEKQVIDKLQGKSAEVGQVQAILRDLKPEEVKWSGIEEFLKGKKKVDRQELLDFIRANSLQITEVTLADREGSIQPGDRVYTIFSMDGEGGETYFDLQRAEAAAKEDYGAGNYEIQEMEWDGETTIVDAEQNEATFGKPKFAQYTLPGGENYREVLLTMPPKEGDLVSDIKIEQNESGEWDVKNESGRVIYTGSERTDAVEYRNELQREREISGKNQFKSSHFDEKNILAHVRLNDRTDADGKRVLFVEEIQSDWHQAGRKKGYRGDERPFDQAEYEALSNKINNAASKAPDTITNPGMRVPWAIKEGLLTQAEYDRMVELNDLKYEGSATSKVPDAPFKKSWHEFALKRIMRMAAEGGYDKVAWTTGEQQAERYDLSKQISKIQYNVQKKELVAYDLQGDVVMDKSGIEKDDLSDYIGKEAADRLLSVETYKTGGNNDVHMIEGTSLKVGGEGMKGFYDNILVKSADKMFKKFGAKVGETQLKIDESGLDQNDRDKLLLADLKDQNISKVHSLDVTPELKDAALNQGFELYQDVRGRIRFGNNRQFNIDLFKSRDESTFLHESAHFFFEVYGDFAEAKNAPQSIKDDYQKMLDFVGVKSRADVGTEQHEKFARAFESYMMEGKSPSQALKKVFHTFKTWLTSIYRQAKNLNVEMTDEIRGVFDRMLATEQEIESAKSELGIASIFQGDPRRAGLSEQETYDYLNAAALANMDAKDELRAKVMKDLIRKKDKAYQAKYDEIYASEMAKAQEMPEFKAIAAITGEVKLSKEAIDQEFSEFKKTMPRGSTIKQDGLHPDVVASMMGYASGQEMLAAIAPYYKGIDSFVESRAAEEIKKTYPELLESPELSEEAIRALHNENYRALKRMELKHLATNDPQVLKTVASKLIRRMPSDKAVKEQAVKLIAATNVRDIKPHIYRNNEKKFSIQAAKFYKQGEFEKAFEAKRKEYLNFELYVQAMDAKEDVKKSLDKFKKMFKKDEDMAKSRDVDLVNAARAILAEFQIMRADKTADEYLRNMRQYDLETYSMVKALYDSSTEKKGNYENVSYDTFVEMRDAVDSLYDLAKSRREIQIDGKKMSLDKVKEDLLTQVDAITPDVKTQYEETVTKMGKIKMILLGARASLTRVESWAKAMDVQDNGPFHKYIWQPISDATTKYRLQKNEVLKKYRDLLDAYRSNLTNDKIVADDLRFIFKDKAELMMAVLHTGNESNKKKLLLGRKWGSENSDGTLNTDNWDRFIKRMVQQKVLTKADFDFAQNIWDLLESLKPDSQRAHKEMFGYYFNEITAKEISVDFGEGPVKYRGGYVPAKADTYTVEDAKIRQEREQFENNNNSFQFPTTGKGFTKSRVENYTVPLSLDMNLLGGHIDGVLRFTYIEPRVKEVSRIALDPGFRQQLSKIDTQIASEMLVPWLQRAAQQQTILPSATGLGKATDAAARLLRRNVATQIMMGNVTNTLQQTTGLIVAMSKVDPKYIRNSLVEYVSNNKAMVEAIMEKSDWMKSTQGSNIFELHQQVKEILVNPSTFEKAKEFTAKHTYFLQAHAQNMVNAIVWKGAYDQAIERKMTDLEAVKFADSAVRTTQGTTNPEDVSRFETGTATDMLFKQFVSYFNMLANLNASEITRIQRDVGLRKGMGRGFYLYLTAVMLPAVLSDVIVRAMAGKWDDDDDDQYLDDTLKVFFGSQVKTGLATVPYVGQLGVAAYNKMFTKNIADDRLSLSPVLSIIESSVGVPYELYKDAADRGELKKKTVKDSLQLIGIITGTPTGPLGRPIGYLMDVESGKARPSGPVDFTRGLITGKPGDK